jgi:hypothetical protein
VASSSTSPRRVSLVCSPIYSKPSDNPPTSCLHSTETSKSTSHSSPVTCEDPSMDWPPQPAARSESNQAVVSPSSSPTAVAISSKSSTSMAVVIGSWRSDSKKAHSVGRRTSREEGKKSSSIPPPLPCSPMEWICAMD